MSNLVSAGIIVAVAAGAGVLGGVVGGYLWGSQRELCAPGETCTAEADLLGGHVTSLEAAVARGALIFAAVVFVIATLYAAYAWFTKPTR